MDRRKYILAMLMTSYVLATAVQCEDYSRHRIVRAVPRTQDQVQLMQEVARNASRSEQVHVLHDKIRVLDHVDMLLPDGAASEQILDTIKASGVETQVLAQDVNRLLSDERQRLLDHDDISDNSTFSTSGFHTNAEITDWMFAEALKCPDSCEVFKIGRSYEGRAINVIKVSTDPQLPIVWIDAGLHAREWIAPATAVYVIQKLLHAAQGVDTSGEHLLRMYTWYILPVANPDGYEYTWTTNRLWRKTRSQHPLSHCVGADPNRNWNFHWTGPGTSGRPCSNNYRGRYPFSEPETRAMATFLWRLRHRLDVYLTLHSYGQYWLTPWGYSRRLPDDYDDLTELGRLAANALRQVNGTEYTVGSAANLLYLASGGSDDWMKGVARVKYAYTLELSDRGTHGFILPPQHIASVAHEVYRALEALGTELHQRKIRLRHVMQRT